ncbi:MAG: hypothetical protein CMN72_05980 [Sphingomonas sp.]|nr:hypothetical protein [Sphingomonas sp.]
MIGRFYVEQELKRRGSTVILSTHRPAVLRIADKIMVLRDGTVQAFGPREKMLARDTGDKGSGNTAGADDSDLVEAAE